MADKMKHDFYVSVIRQVAREPYRSEMALFFKTVVKNLCSYCSIVRHDRKYPNQMFDCSCGRFWNFIQVCLRFTSLQQRGHLETTPPFTAPCEGRETR